MQVDEQIPGLHRVAGHRKEGQCAADLTEPVGDGVVDLGIDVHDQRAGEVNAALVGQDGGQRQPSHQPVDRIAPVAAAVTKDFVAQ